MKRLSKKVLFIFLLTLILHPIFIFSSTVLVVLMLSLLGINHRCIEDLSPVVGRKRAKESARFFKTYNSQIQADIILNMRSFANFQKLRNSEHSQLEIRKLAAIMLELVENIDGNPFKFTL